MLANSRSLRRRTLAPGQRALPIAELAEADAIYGYSFILTDVDCPTSELAVVVEHWYRHRTTGENLFRDGKHGATLCHFPSGGEGVPAGQHRVDVGRAAGAQHRRLATPADRHRLIAIPARLVRHAGALILRPPPGHGLPADVLAPTPSPTLRGRHPALPGGTFQVAPAPQQHGPVIIGGHSLVRGVYPNIGHPSRS